MTGSPPETSEVRAFRRDPAAWLAGLSRALREEGADCSVTESVLAGACVAHLDTTDPEELFLGLRAAFCASRRDLEAFQACFWRRWRGEPRPPRPAHPVPAREAPANDGAPGHPRPAPPLVVDAGAAEGSSRRAGTAYSASEHLARRSFADIHPDEVRELDEWIARLVVRLSTRRSRRLEPGGRRGPVHLRRSASHAVRTDGEWVRLLHRRRRRDPPRLVVLCDISGSMERYSRFLVRFLLATARARDIATFAFSTRLVHLDPWLSRAGVDEALEAMRRRGWSSGTRIGECLETFVERHGSALLGRRTVVVILSDGLDQGEVEPLERAMSMIQRKSRRVIWLNPLLESSRYAPEARGMRAALPYVDHFASGHNLEALGRLPALLRL